MSCKQEQGRELAPIVGWTNGSPSISPGADKTVPRLPMVPASPARSATSSGIGRDSPRTASVSESGDYSPALSSIGCEPPLLPSSPSVLSKESDKTQDKEEADEHEDHDNEKTPLRNGSVPAHTAVPMSVVITNNPAYEVKFQDNQDEKCVKINAMEKDSICSSSYSEDYEEEDEEEKKPKVPDGGWGWVVVFSSLVISMVADGISFSFGLLFVEFLKHFEESNSKTSWIGSLFMAVPLLSGPAGSALVDRYGCRWMTITGGLISGFGFVLSSFSNTIELQFITFGVIAGLGLGLCYVTAVVSIAYWFDKKRTLATGLGACGTGIGTFVYAPMTTYFIQEYGWRGTILLLAGTFLNMCVCGALMRDPEWWTLEQTKSASLSTGNKSMKGASSCGSISGRSVTDVESQFPGVEEIRKLLKSGQTPEYILTTLATYVDKEKAVDEGEEKAEGTKTPAYSSVINLPTFIRQSETVPLEVLETLSSNKKLFNVILENYPSLLLCRSLSDNGKINAIPSDYVQTRVPVTMSMRLKAANKSQRKSPPGPEKDAVAISSDTAGAPLLPGGAGPGVQIVKSPVRTKSILGRPPPRTESLTRIKRQFCSTTPQASHYLQGIRVHRNSVMYRGAMLNIHRYRLRASSCPDIYRNSMTTIARENEEKWYSDFLDLIKGMLDFSMFLELHFLLMSLSTILLFTWFIVPYFYLADFMSLYNFTEAESSLMLSVIGISSTIGMVGLGWAGDQPWMNVTKSYAVCLMMCGLAVCAMPLCLFALPAMLTSGAVFGLFFASTFSFTPVILVQLIPLDRFTTAYGLILLCQGIGNLTGPPLAGWVRDFTGIWDLSFYLAGVWIVVSGVLIAAIPPTKNRKIWGSGLLEKEKEMEDRLSCA
ncbi:monocarboxylate transporter 14 [Anabrus simplex]|uniref:monocarboxylate transporter 14 n=1 Tax=Anabrus simplex TaxID=316456 RepID=UPI0035A2F9D5